jgi:hypothetical protein
MKHNRFFKKRIAFSMLITLILCGCVEQEVTPTVREPVVLPSNTRVPITLTVPAASNTLLPSETAISVPSPTLMPQVETSSPTQAPVEATLPPQPATMGSTLPPGMPAAGIWISSHARRGSEAWIQFEIYYRDGEPIVDVLEACISYSCDVIGELFEAEGCSETQSPKQVPIKNGKFQIDFGDIMPETVTHNSKFGTIISRVNSQEEITGSWILPACDLWLNLDVEHLAVTPTP